MQWGLPQMPTRISFWDVFSGILQWWWVFAIVGYVAIRGFILFIPGCLTWFNKNWKIEIPVVIVFFAFAALIYCIYDFTVNKGIYLLPDQDESADLSVPCPPEKTVQQDLGTEPVWMEDDLFWLKQE